jgi:hypothetical protein
MPPTVPRWPQAFFKNMAHLDMQLEILNSYLLTVQRVARDMEVPLANFWRTFPDLVDDYPGPYFDAPDNYHPNHTAQPILANGIADIVRPAFERWNGDDNCRGRSA